MATEIFYANESKKCSIVSSCTWGHWVIYTNDKNVSKLYKSTGPEEFIWIWWLYMSPFSLLSNYHSHNLLQENLIELYCRQKYVCPWKRERTYADNVIWNLYFYNKKCFVDFTCFGSQQLIRYWYGKYCYG